jgi:hypothetical protein
MPNCPDNITRPAVGLRRIGVLLALGAGDLLAEGGKVIGPAARNGAASTVALLFIRETRYTAHMRCWQPYL